MNQAPPVPPADLTSSQETAQDFAVSHTRPHTLRLEAGSVSKPPDAKETEMAAKVETLRFGTKTRSNKVGIVAAIGAAMFRWGERGQLGPSTTEIGRHTGARC